MRSAECGVRVRSAPAESLRAEPVGVRLPGLASLFLRSIGELYLKLIPRHVALARTDATRISCLPRLLIGCPQSGNTVWGQREDFAASGRRLYAGEHGGGGADGVGVR